MPLAQVLDILALIDRPDIDLAAIAERLTLPGTAPPRFTPARSSRGRTTFVRAVVPGTAGRLAGGRAPTLGIIGFLGGVGARPAAIGLVSDADGAVAALAAAAKLCSMWRAGDRLAGDVIVTTHLSPAAPVIPHDPVPFMAAPVGHRLLRRRLVDPGMDAILSIDTTRGNRIANRNGIAISPTVKEGYILRVSDDLLSIQERVTGRLPFVLPITTQDITPYGNGVYHLNSIMQPAVETSSPVVGVALTTQAAVAGSATGASHEIHIATAARFAVEVAKAFGAGRARFYDPDEFRRLQRLYGSLAHLQRVRRGTRSAGPAGTRQRPRPLARRGPA
jgi:hypothetical protein